ncbi:mandelate racemase/muconate lactonizing enzyme family protein [Streptomyces sp. NPDC048636]|uniref:mandelate racemase/muconate lactonizing enzyme family protein n=1 Tax=Streptomyces sp. NPDC048636 TaxID=3155762 RepID=UPI003427C773
MTAPGPRVSTRPGMVAASIAAVDVYPVTVPRRGVYALQRGNSAVDSWFALVRVTADDGTYGWGECVTRVKSMHHIATDHLRGRLIGHDVCDIEGYHRVVDEEEMLAIERLWHWNPIRAAIEMALFDIQGKLLRVSLGDLLGGARRTRIPTVKNIGIGSPESAADIARRYTDEGYTLVKARVGGDPAVDEARLAAIRDAIPDDVRIRIDANQAWSWKEALRLIGRYSAYGLEAVEQPCDFWDVSSNARVTAESPVPIISDEGFVSASEAQLLLTGGGADVLHAYLGKCGGISPVMAISTLASSFGAVLTMGERVPLGVSEAAHLHVASVLPSLAYPCALAYDLNEDDLLIDSPARSGGHLDVPQGPGLGVDVDLDKVAFYARKD